MQEQLVSLQTARLAKDKDFDWKVYQMYRQEILTDRTSLMYDWNSQNCIDFISAPTQSLLQRWLREVHKINITIRSGMFNGQTKIYHYSLPYHEESTNWGKFESYELALEAGLLAALKLIK